MSQPLRQRTFLWLALCGAAVALLWWIDLAAVQRLKSVADRYTERPAPAADSPTGYTGGKRFLIPLDHNTESLQWIVQAQQLAEADSLRLREVGYDNAPRTRPVYSPSPYRWWLLGLGQLRADAERPLGLAIEQGMLWADPVLHGLLMILVVGVLGWRFGLFTAAVAALLFGLSFSTLSAFYPGSPNDRGLATLGVIVSLLALLVGASGWRPRLMFVLSGVIGAFGLWVDPNRMTPVLGGIGLGGLFAAWWLARAGRKAATGSAPTVTLARLPWRGWALAGALATLAAWAAENVPDRWDPRTLLLREIHPLYALAWLGLGLVLARASAALTQGRAALRWVGVLELLSGLLAVAALPVAMGWTGQSGFLAGDAMSAQLSPIPGSERGVDFPDWLAREGVRLSFWALALPIVGSVIIALWGALRRKLDPEQSRLTLLLTGPVLVGLVVSWQQVSWWMTTGSLAALLLCVLASQQTEGRSQVRLALAVGAALLPSLIRVLPQVMPTARERLTFMEQRTLAERDLAYWLAKRTDDYRSVVLAPPEMVPALHYYGGVRGLGSPYQGNDEGFGAAVRISAATSPDEAEALATQRELSHIVLPNWDAFLDEYARLGAAQPQNTLVALLHNWLPPRWLRAVHHELPKIDGFEDNGAVIFEVVDVQDNATALSRLGEYFVETGRMRFALGISKTLEDSFPSDLGGLVARAQIAVALSDRVAFEKVMKQIIPYLEDARDGDLMWDRRVNLATLLMLAQERDYAIEQVQFCMDEVDEYLLRTVTPPTLYRFMLLCETLDEPFPEDYLREAALQQLTAEQRQALAAPAQPHS